ncbi:MAG TPA: hypothetical protein VLH10_22600 [Yinghuangia sp.]|uniref:hypothetical protein n=1 Tax=Yinghuangia sp. YIM S10712 TaxID=3436930 RepID=UPI002C2B49E9|nr:hypothetical protein [Yinghuangia sp.]
MRFRGKVVTATAAGQGIGAGHACVSAADVTAKQGRRLATGPGSAKLVNVDATAAVQGVRL